MDILHHDRKIDIVSSVEREFRELRSKLPNRPPRSHHDRISCQRGAQKRAVDVCAILRYEQ